MEGRFPSASSVVWPTGGWKPPLLQTTAGGVNLEMHPMATHSGANGNPCGPRQHSNFPNTLWLLQRKEWEVSGLWELPQAQFGEDWQVIGGL
jgi:hypothetical protein